MTRNKLYIILLSMAILLAAYPAAWADDAGESPCEPEAVSAPQTGAAQIPAGTHEHTVIKGDTLWDISGGYLNDPFLWPEIWELNPGIKNPHLIYPGQMVIVPGPGPEMAGEPGEAPGKTAGAEGSAAPGAVKGDEDLPDLFTEEPLVDISQTLLVLPVKKEKKVISLDTEGRPRIPVATEGAILEAGFISDDYENSFKILGSPLGDREIFSFGDEVYLERRTGLNPGDMLVSVRPEMDVEHPAYGDDIGKLMKVSGLFVVEGEKEGYALCKVSKTVNDIRSTDLLLPYKEPYLVYEPVRKNLQLKGEWGYIVMAQDARDLNAATYIIYLDLGKKDGVRPGDTFVVKRSGQSGYNPPKNPRYLVDLIGEKYILPDEEVGTVQVISVQDRTATAKVTDFSEPIKIGYRAYYQD